MTTSAPSSYGWETASLFGKRGIVNRPIRSHVGNIVLEVGEENADSRGWHKVAHVVLSPDEARRLIADITLMLEPDAPIGPQPPEVYAAFAARQTGATS